MSCLQNYVVQRNKLWEVKATGTFNCALYTSWLCAWSSNCSALAAVLFVPNEWNAWYFLRQQRLGVAFEPSSQVPHIEADGCWKFSVLVPLRNLVMRACCLLFFWLQSSDGFVVSWYVNSPTSTTSLSCWWLRIDHADFLPLCFSQSAWDHLAMTELVLFGLSLCSLA